MFVEPDNIFVSALSEMLLSIPQNDQLLKFAGLMLEKPGFQ